jgi:hypothetical protein
VLARRPDLAVTTTRADGIPALLEAAAGRAVTDLWRRPPAGELVTDRYLRILYEEGLLAAEDLAARPRVYLDPAERARASGRSPPGCRRPAGRRWCWSRTPGMAVKRWPGRHWPGCATCSPGRGHPVLRDRPEPVRARPHRRFAAAPRRAARRRRPARRRRGRRDTGPLRLAAAAGAATVALFGPTPAGRYGLGEGAELQGLPACPHRRPTSITEQVCWWHADCPLSPVEPACMADIGPTPSPSGSSGCCRREPAGLSPSWRWMPAPPGTGRHA